MDGVAVGFDEYVEAVVDAHSATQDESPADVVVVVAAAAAVVVVVVVIAVAVAADVAKRLGMRHKLLDRQVVES